MKENIRTTTSGCRELGARTSFDLGVSRPSETAVAISSAFGAEGMVLIDIASRVRQNFRLFTLDTEFLFPETYNLMDQVEQKYGITIERVYPLLSPEEQERTHGSALWQRNPDQCCNMRKVEPLRHKLRELTSVDHQHTSRSDHRPGKRRQNRMG